MPHILYLSLFLLIRKHRGFTFLIQSATPRTFHYTKTPTVTCFVFAENAGIRGLAVNIS